MSHKLTLLDGAYIISDAHYSHKRPELLSLIRDIASHKLQVSQLILMGDVFDALFGGIPYTYKENSEMIELLNKISLEIELIYLEGNHDFNLKKVFKNAKVFTLSSQPITCSYRDMTLSLAHGDFDGEYAYRLYCALIRNPILLFILKYVDIITNHTILKKLDSYLGIKDDCKEFIGFEKYIKNRSLESYSSEYFIEGHYHQNLSFKFEKFNYLNLGAFACNQRYFIVKSSQDNELCLEEKSYKEI